MAVVYSKVLLFDPPLIYTAPDICVFGAVYDICLLSLQSEFTSMLLTESYPLQPPFQGKCLLPSSINNL